LLPVLPPDEALALLRKRLELVEDNAAVLARQIEQVSAANFPPLFLIESEHRLAMLRAELQFVAELIRRIENGWGPLDLWRGFHQDREATIAKFYKQYGDAPIT
jgi:hypothetical protein